MRILLLILLPFFTFGQETILMLNEWKSIHHKRDIEYHFDWENIENHASKVNKENFYNYIINNTSDRFCYALEEKSLENLITYQGHYFHFIDIDNDGDIDVIYDGRMCPGYESETVIIYLKSSNGYNKISYSGKVVNIKPDTKQITIYSYGCCAIPQSSLQFLTFKNDTVHKKSLTFIDNSMFYNDKFENYHQKFVIEKINIKKNSDLYISPTEKFSGLFENRINNIFGILKNDESVKSYYRYIDKETNIWYLCVIDCDKIKSTWSDRYKLLNYCEQYVAWIKFEE